MQKTIKKILIQKVHDLQPAAPPSQGSYICLFIIFRQTYPAQVNFNAQTCSSTLRPSLYMRFPVRGDFVPAGDTWPCLEVFLVVTIGRCYLYLVEDEDAAKHPSVHPAVLSNRKSSSPRRQESQTLDTEIAEEKDWLFYCEWHHPEEQEASAQKPKLLMACKLQSIQGKITRHPGQALGVVLGAGWSKVQTGTKSFLQVLRTVLWSILVSLCLLSWGSRQGIIVP